MDVNAAIGLISAGVMGFIWWDIKTMKKENQTDRKENSDAIKAMVNACHECQKELPVLYATKTSVDRLWTRTDQHESDISYLKGIRNGATSQ